MGISLNSRDLKAERLEGVNLALTVSKKFQFWNLPLSESLPIGSIRRRALRRQFKKEVL